MALPNWAKKYQTSELINNVTADRPAPQPVQEEWDYKNAQADQNGNPAPAGSQGYDPLGRPYFGPGITGTFKKYYHQLMGAPTSGVGLDNWNAIVDDFKKAETQRGQEWKETNFDILKRSAAGLFGAESANTDGGKLTEQDTAALDGVNQKLKDRQKQIEEEIKAGGGSVNPQSLQSAISNDELYKNILRERNSLAGTNLNKASTVDLGGQSFSLLTPVVRATQVGLTALIDILQEPAQKIEQLAGANLKAIESTEGTIQTRSKLGNFFLSMTPVGVYNQMRFVFSPKTPQEKMELLKTGWDSGRILYSEMYDETIQAEFERRAEEGEDPQLLAMELANPWAEMAGQLILDPLNAIGFFSKAAKAGAITDDVADQVKAVSGLSDSPEFVNAIENMAKAGGEGDAVRAGDEVIAAIQKHFDNPDVVPVQSYKAIALNSAGNQMKAIRNMGNTFTWIVASISKGGGGMDEVTDAVSALIKLSSKNADEVQDGFAALTHFPSPMTYFNENSLQTSKMIRNLLEGADGVMDVKKFVEKVKKFDNWTAYGNKLKSIMDDAARFEYPSVSEMKVASENVKEALAIGNKVPEKTAKLAEQYKELLKAHPGVTKLAEINDFTSRPKNFINGVLSTFYFSLNYGFATRNWLQNNLVMLIDAGPKAWFRDGQYMSNKFVDQELGKWFQDGVLPPSISNYKPIGKEFGGADILASKLSSKIEESASKRVFFKFFRDTMDKALQPGKALPTLQEFKTAGFTEGQVNRFTSLVKENYGNVGEAVKRFTQEYASGGPDMWRMVDQLIPPKAYKGLVDNGMMDEIVNFVKRDDVGKEDINKFIDGLITEEKKRAGSIVDDPVGMSADNPYVRERADLFAGSEKYADSNTQSYLDQLFERSTQTRDQYVKALQEIRNKTGDPELSKFLDGLMMREPDDIIRKQVAGINQNTRNLIAQARKGKTDLQLLWKQLGSESSFSGLSAEEFASAAWDYTLKERVPKMWDSHFGAIFAESERYATKYGVSELLQQARDMNKEAQTWRTSVYRGGQSFDAKLVDAEIGTAAQGSNIRAIAKTYGISSATAEGVSADKKLLNMINKRTGNSFTTLDEVSNEIAEQAFSKANENPLFPPSRASLRKTTGTDTISTDLRKQEVSADLEKMGADYKNKYGQTPIDQQASSNQIPPPYLQGSTPTLARAHAETAAGSIDALNQLKRKMLDSFGMKAFDEVSPNLSTNLESIAQTTADRIAESQLIAQKVGEHWRDFALLPYGETTHLDHALSYIYPYQFWYSRSYSNWFKRLASDPQIIAAYAKQKDLMAQIHKDSPEWFKQNITLPSFMGINNGNPIFLNLEATLWPLYGLTGTDFNDPAKRQDWLGATIDDMGKFGPSMWSPINLAIAAGYSAAGEEEAAQGWASRVIPQTATIKAILAQAGQYPVELDPAVMIWSGSEDGNPFHSLDKYERKRVGYAVAEMMTQGIITEEEAIEASRTQQGPIWEQAVIAATQKRAPGQIASAFLGVGFKARTEADVQLDEFYGDYFKMQELNKNGYLSTQDYKEQFNAMREQYPFMDTVLLSRRAGDDREAAYAYNIISRIPPGMSNEIFEKIGIDPETARLFYDSGGKFTDWNEQEKNRFMTAMVDAGAILSIPSNADRREWTKVKYDYSVLQDGVSQMFGEDINEKINLYFNMDKKAANLYIQAHPEIGEAIQFQDEMIVNNSLLMKYYGGLDKLEKYYTGKMYDTLAERHGENIMILESFYFDLPPDQRKQFLGENPQLKDYWQDKSEIKEENFRHIVQFGSFLQEPSMETYADPQNPTQEDLYNLANPQPAMSFGEWQQVMGEPMTELVLDYYQDGEELPAYAEKNLDYLAGQYGYESGQDMLRDVLISYRSGQ